MDNNNYGLSSATTAMGQFQYADLTFLQPNGVRFILRLSPDELAKYRNAANGYTIDFAAVWGTTLVRDLVASPDLAGSRYAAADITNYNVPKQQYTIDDCYLYQIDLQYGSLEPSWRPTNHLETADAAADAQGLLDVRATGETDWYNAAGNVDTNQHTHNGAAQNRCQSQYFTTYTSGGVLRYTNYYPHDNTLHSSLFLTQTGAYDTRALVEKCAGISVPRPRMEVHSFVQYGQADYTEQVRADSSNTDANRTEVTVPYAKNFTFQAQLRNEPRSGASAYSKLDDADVTVTYPLDFEANIVTGPGTTNNKMSTWTGFHPTFLPPYSFSATTTVM